MASCNLWAPYTDISLAPEEEVSDNLATISEDRTKGSNAHEEANLKSLDRSQSALSLTTDFAAARAPLPARGGNHALQDYQMQLMMLEQQNKKRLMMARQEQGYQSDESEITESTSIGGVGEVGRSLPDELGKQEGTIKHDAPENFANQIGELGSITNPKSSRKRQPATREATIDATLNPPAKRQATENWKANRRLTSGVLSTGSTILSNTDPTSPPPLYRIECSKFEYHSVDLYADLPQRLSTGRCQGHFSGAYPVYDVEKFVSDAGDLGFQVFKSYKCLANHQRLLLNTRDRVGSDSISIISVTLKDIISRIAKCLLSNMDSWPNEFEIPSPYNFIFHHRSELLKKVGPESFGDHTSTHHSAITALLQYVDESQGEVFREADKLFKEGQTTMQHLQRLFCPNEVVIARHDNIFSAYVLIDWPRIEGDSSWSLSCWSWGYDGLFFRRKDIRLSLRYLLGEVTRITDLGVFPLRFAPEGLKKELIERGKQFWNLRHKHYVSYNGWDFKKEDFYSSARCMIDYQTYRKFHGFSGAFSFSEGSKLLFDNRRDNIHQSEIPNEEDYILMPPQIHGFVLKEKKWVSFLVHLISPIQWNKDAFRRLVIPPRTKELVKALISVRKTGSDNQQSMGFASTRDDIITGKGNGLIMLLHGGPGTGKTLTAESVAEIAEMPLYSVTCGDIGTTPEGVEKYLKTVLYLGKTWNCVLLLDEADVFLEERTLQDLERNSLVSVFLRVLEYYEGILVLTSNRVGIFDEAFKSRIQVALHYQPLTSVSRRQIWQNFLDMLQIDKENVDFQEITSHLEELSDYEMNGREIRNAFTTARQIALYKKETLNWDHIEVTINSARDFTRYLGKIHGHTEEQWAREKKER